MRGGRVSKEFCSCTGTVVAQKNTNRNMNRFARKIAFDLKYGYFSSLGSEISIMEPFAFYLSYWHETKIVDRVILSSFALSVSGICNGTSNMFFS